MGHTRLPKRDCELVQIVDVALAEAARKSGAWLVCKPGCTQCCYGPFPISQLDAARLRRGLEDLGSRDPQRAARVKSRAVESLQRLSAGFTGDVETGILAEDERSVELFDGFANEEPCPALDLETGTCDLYESRPMTCRTFGPPIRSGPEEGLGVCELCYHGATATQIAACEMVPDPDGLEARLIKEIERSSGLAGNTIVAFTLAK